jgi:hypothetical protein
MAAGTTSIKIMTSSYNIRIIGVRSIVRNAGTCRYLLHMKGFYYGKKEHAWHKAR